MKMNHPKPSLTPSGVAFVSDFVSDFCKAATDKIAVDTAVAILSHHPDPTVTAALGIIQRLCIFPWSAAMDSDTDLTLTPTVTEVFEFTLRNDRSVIGSAELCALRISILPAFFAIVTKDSETENEWTLELSTPSGNEIYGLNVVPGESWPIDQREETRLRCRRNHYGGSPKTKIKPGDVIVIEKWIEIHVKSPSNNDDDPQEGYSGKMD